MMRRGRAYRLASLVAIGACLGIVFAIGLDAIIAKPRPGVDPLLLRHFRVFAAVSRVKRSLVKRPPFPVRLGAALTGGQPGYAVYGPKPQRAVYVHIAHETDMWLVPGAAGVCVFRTLAIGRGVGFGGACYTTRTADAGEAFSERDSTTGTLTIAGIVPDAVTRVVALGAGHRMLARVAVSHNAYYIGGTGAYALELQSAHGLWAKLPVVALRPPPGGFPTNPLRGAHSRYRAGQ